MKRVVPFLILFLVASGASASATLFSSSGNDPTVGFLPSYNDVYTNWQNAGLATIGGYPRRTTVCATVRPLGSGQDDTTNIQNAINSCSAGEVVQLAAGTFSIMQADIIDINKGITLRGSGTCNNSSSPYCQTVIKIPDGSLEWGGNCGRTPPGTACTGGPELLMGPPIYTPQWSGCAIDGKTAACAGAIPLAADAAAGSTTIRVISTSNLSVGMWVLIDEASGAGWQTDPVNSGTQIWAAPDWTNTSGSPVTGRVAWQKHNPSLSWDDFSSTSYPFTSLSTGCYFSFCDRPTAELHLIKAIGAGPCPGVHCTITFDDPITVAFRISGGTVFTGSVKSGSSMLTVHSGTPLVGQIVAGTGIPWGTYITGRSGIFYTISANATANEASETMTSGSHEAQIYYPSNLNGSGTTTPIEYAGLENISFSRTVKGVVMDFCMYCWVKNVEVANWFQGGINVTYSARDQIDTVYVHECNQAQPSGAEYPIDLQAATTEIYVVNSITLLCGKGMTARSGGAGSVVAYNYMDQTYYQQVAGGPQWVELSVNGSHAAGTHMMLFEGNRGANLDSDDTHGPADYHTFFRNWGTGLRTPFTDPADNIYTDDQTHRPGNNQPLRAAGVMTYTYWMAFVGNVPGEPGVTTSGKNWLLKSNFPTSGTGSIWFLGWNNQTPYESDPNCTTETFQNGNFDYLDTSVSWASGYTDHNLPNSFYLSSKPSFFSQTGSTGCTYPWPWVTPTISPEIQTNSCGGDGLPAKARYDAGTPFVQP